MDPAELAYFLAALADFLRTAPAPVGLALAHRFGPDATRWAAAILEHLAQSLTTTPPTLNPGAPA